jgi:sensor histidine kinase YesM
MDSFLVNISSFPTAIYTTSLVVVVGYWLFALFGALDFDAFDADIDIDVDSGVSDLSGVAGFMATLGLTGVPITIVISLLLLNAWLVCYFLALFTPALPQFASWILFIVHMGVVIVSFLVSILLTAIMIRPLRGLFRKVHQVPKSISLLGASCRIRSSRVDGEFGEAECQNEGASLIIKVRTSNGEVFATGDRAVVIEHNQQDDFFYVVSEEAFRQRMG